MGSPYTASPVALGTITVPADGDNRNAAVFNVPMQAIADGVAFEAARVTAIADLTALAAVTTPANGLVKHVIGFGWYVFQTSATTGISPYRVAAADATPGGWTSGTAHETTLTRYVPANRIAGIASAAQVPALVGPYVGLTSGSQFQLGAGSMQVGPLSSSTTLAWGVVLPIDGWLVNGATLASIVATFTPSFTQAQPSPGQAVQFGVMASPRGGYSVGTHIPLSLLSAGFVLDSGAKVAGTNRTLTLTTDQNNVIDLATYSYAISLWDEHGTGAASGNTFHTFAISLTGIANARR
jgi:hypothetical protein